MTTCAVFAAALRDPLQPVPSGLKVRSGADVAQRFSVHRNNRMASLVEALASSFAVVQMLVGEAFFQASARAFIRQHPPTSPVLADFGERFADFLAEFPPALELPYLADVARLEWLRQCALYAADACPLPEADLRALIVQPERLAQHRWYLHPALGVLTSPYPVVSIWAAHQHADEDQVRHAMRSIHLGDGGNSGAEAALVLRSTDGWSAEVVPVSVAQARLVEVLREQGSLAQAVQAALGADPELDVSATLALLWSRGVWISDPPTTPEPACTL